MTKYILMILVLIALILFAPYLMMWSWNNGVVPHIGGTYEIKSYWAAVAVMVFITSLKIPTFGEMI